MYRGNIDNRVIKGAEEAGVHAISPNLVFLKLRRITGFQVIFQTSDLNNETVSIGCALTSWTRYTQGWGLELENEHWNSPKTSKNVTFAQFSDRPGKFLHRLQKINIFNRCRIKNYTRNDSENVKNRVCNSSFRAKTAEQKNQKLRKWCRSMHQSTRLVELNNFCSGFHMKNSKNRYEKCEKPRKKRLLPGFQTVL